MFVPVCMWPSINAKNTGHVFLKLYIWDLYKNYQAILSHNRPDLCKAMLKVNISTYPITGFTYIGNQYRRLPQLCSVL